MHIFMIVSDSNKLAILINIRLYDQKDEYLILSYLSYCKIDLTTWLSVMKRYFLVVLVALVID